MGDRAKARRKIYQTEQWKLVRIGKLMEQPVCELCDARGIVTLAVDVHHADSITNYEGDYDYYLYKTGQAEEDRSVVDTGMAAGGGKSGSLAGNTAAKSSVSPSETKVTVNRHPRGEKPATATGGPVQLTAPKQSAPKSKEQKRREAEARNRAYAALKNHRKRIAELDAQMERDNARLAEVLELLSDPDFYTREDSSSDVIAEHAKLKQRIEHAEEEWLLLNEELEEEMARQAAQS